MSEELKACPVAWCRRDDPPHTWQDSADDWVVICPSCGVNGPCVPTKSEAVGAWNNLPRTPTEAPGEAEVERVAEWLFDTFEDHDEPWAKVPESWVVKNEYRGYARRLAALRSTTPASEPEFEENYLTRSMEEIAAEIAPAPDGDGK